MPTYSYKCTECGTAFDIQQAFTDDTLTECPNCGGKLRKIFSAVGVTFNGSGFYRNDSREKKSTSAAKSSSDSSSGSSSSSDSSSSASSSAASAKNADSKASSPTKSTAAASPTKAAS